MNIEELDLDIKVYNRLKKNLPDVCTVNHLITEMYDTNGIEKVSAPDMKAIEKALKDKGIFKYMRGDEVSEDDIEPTPLTWEELHNYVGGLVVCDDSTESHRWLHLCWIYSISDKGDTSMMYLCRGNSYLSTRKQYVESDTSATVEMYGEMLRHSGHFFALKQHALRLDSMEDNWPHADIFYYSDSPEVYGKELTYEELCELSANTQVLIDDTFDGDDEDEDLAGELWRKDSQQYSEGVRFECLDDDDCIQTQIITKSMMEKRSTYYTRVFLKQGGTKRPEPKADIISQKPAQVIVSDNYSRAIALTRSIIANGQAAQQSLWEMCKGLAEMRDDKLYKEIGYGTFEDYCEQEIGITRRQGQKYAAIAALDGKSTSDFERIGVEKLYLLAKIDDEQREQITDSVDVESTTVKQLKAQIEALNNAKDYLQQNNHTLSQAAYDARKEAENSALERKRSDDLYKKSHDDLIEAQNEVHRLEQRIKELEARPVDVAVQENTAELEKLRAEYEKKLTELKADSNYTELLAMCRLVRSQVNTLCMRLNGVRSGKEKDTLLKYVKEIGLCIGQLL